MSSVTKIKRLSNSFFNRDLKNSDKDLFDSISQEFVRQKNHIELIASENIVSRAVLEAQLREQKNFLIVNLQMYNRIQEHKLMEQYI